MLAPALWTRPRTASRVVSAHAPGWEQRHWTSRFLHWAGEVSARSTAGIGAAALVLGWTVIGGIEGFPEWWKTVLYSSAASITLVMVFILHHTLRREQVATQLKLDELIRALPQADDHYVHVQAAADEEVQELEERHIEHHRATRAN